MTLSVDFLPNDSTGLRDFVAGVNFIQCTAIFTLEIIGPFGGEHHKG